MTTPARIALIAVALAAGLAAAGCRSADRHPWGEPKPEREAAALAAEMSAASLSDAGMPPAAELTDQHRWLQQLVGEWTFSCEAPAQDGIPAFVMSGTETVRSIGGLWIVAEGRATMSGHPMRSVMSLGYQPEAKAFVGTWIDSVQSHMWSYKGTLDANANKLTLDTEGPSFEGGPGKMSRYRDAIELVDEDHKVLTSSVQGADGQWTTFMRADYQRTR